MKAKIYKDKIINSVANIQGIAGRRSSLAINNCVFISALSDKFKIMASDNETGFKGFYPAVIEEEGVAAINARKFYEIIKDYPENDIFIKKDENDIVKIGNERIEFKIVSLDTEKFNEVVDIEEADFFTMKASILKEMIEKIHMIGFSSDEKRHYILGINFEIINEEGKKIIRIVATDGNRLSKYDHICEDDAKLPASKSVIVPKKGINELYKFIDTEEDINIGFDESSFILKNESETMIIRLIEGSFPQYENVFKKDYYFSIKLDKKKFSMMLKRMSILSLIDYKGVLFCFENNKLIISTENPDIGESREDMNIEFKGEPFTVAFNPKFFQEVISVIEEDEITLYLKDEKNSCIVQGGENTDFLTVIMPMVI